MAVHIGTEKASAALKDKLREQDRIEDELDEDDVVSKHCGVGLRNGVPQAGAM